MVGKTIAHYEITSQLGKGGMGEVYQAKDTKLGRDVAIKVLPEEFARNADRVARFQREAKLLASLNHPNIAAIYGLEESGGTNFLVMELVEGETPADQIKRGPIPVEEALKLALQIAEALEAAHEKGVIHRDLKPANVMISEGYKVKILDFGLAKAIFGETQSDDASQSPTITEAMTRPGSVLGTAAYMSPEQAMGKAVDRRADIWAFGCILYECLTGKRAFEGETATETLAAILRGEPDWSTLPASTPPNVRLVLRRCLEKDVSRRFHCAADVRIQIEEAPEIAEVTAPAKRPWLAWSAAALFLLVALVLAFFHFREKAPAPAEAVRFQVALPDKLSLDWGVPFAISPDGRNLAFSALGQDGVARLWVRALDSLEARPLAGTESPHIEFFWSFDSRHIAFDSGGKLKKIDIEGGPAQTICDLTANAVGGSWNRDGVIIFGSTAMKGGLNRVSVTGGTAFPLAKLDPTRHVLGLAYPNFLPDGRHFVYFQLSDIPEKRGVYIGSLDLKPEEQGSRQLLSTVSQPVYVPSRDSGPGWLLFLREKTLMAQRFDDKRLELIGQPFPLAEQVGSFLNLGGYFSASANGVLVYRSGTAEQLSRAIWFDRQGKNLGQAGETGDHYGLALSPDGTRAAVSLVNQTSTSMDLWLIDFAHGTSTRFTFGHGANTYPVWSPDGSRIIFASTRGGVPDLYQKEASGIKDEELLLKSGEAKAPTSWSSDGRFLLYGALNPKTGQDLWVLPLEGDRKPIPFLRTGFNEADGQFSPDMRWVAYQSDESGSDEIYVRGFSPTSGASSETGGKWQVSVGGGTGPRWRRDGKELFYRAPDGKVMAVEIKAGQTFQSGTPRALFQAPLLSGAIRPITMWDVAPDGSRFLLTIPAKESSSTPFTVVLNWTALLKK